MKLTIELVPSTAWYTNVRSNVSKEQWDIIRKKCYLNAGFKCEICGGVGPKWPVECHEIWEYDNDNYTQTLTGFIALCPNCHKVKHIGYAQISGNFDLAFNQLKEVNNLSSSQANTYINARMMEHTERSQHEWEINISYIELYIK